MASLVLLAACSLPPPSGPVERAEETDRPVLVGSSLVDPRSGEVVGTVLEEAPGRLAVPVAGEPGVFALGARRVDVRRVPPATRFGFELWKDSERVARFAGCGVELWSTPLEGPSDAGDQGMAYDEERVYVLAGRQTHALDAVHGTELWSKADDMERILLVGNVLYGAGTLTISGRDARDGHLLFERRNEGLGRMEPLLAVSGGLLLRAQSFAGEPLGASLIAPDGTLRWHRDEELVAAFPRGENALVLTRHGVELLGRDGGTHWENRRFPAASGDAARLLELPGGELALITYSSWKPTGVRVLVFREVDGAVRFDRECAALPRIDKEWGHEAYVEARGDALVVVSQNVLDSFVEVLGRASGRTRARWEFPGPR